MSDHWFRWRPPDVGQGYSIANWKGWAAAALFIVVSTVAAIVPPVMASGATWSFIAAALLFLAVVGGFIWVVRTHSDWNG